MNNRDTKAMRCDCDGYVKPAFPHRRGSKYCLFRADGSRRMPGDPDFRDQHNEWKSDQESENREMSVNFDSFMLDLETMGLGPNAAVIQIGIRAFNFERFAYGPGFEVNVDLRSAVEMGGVVGEDTVRWWADRGGPPTANAIGMQEALGNLTSFIQSVNPEPKRVWAQGPSFDIAVMEGYFQRGGLPAPWAYSTVRDTRTVYDLAKQRGWEKPSVAVAHTALADCDEQIEMLAQAMAVLNAERWP